MAFMSDLENLIKIINTRTTIMSVDGWDDSSYFMDVVIHCNDYVAAAKVDEESDKLAFYEFTRRKEAAWKWLKDQGLGL